MIRFTVEDSFEQLSCDGRPAQLHLAFRLTIESAALATVRFKQPFGIFKGQQGFRRLLSFQQKHAPLIGNP